MREFNNWIYIIMNNRFKLKNLYCTCEPRWKYWQCEARFCCIQHMCSTHVFSWSVQEVIFELELSLLSIFFIPILDCCVHKLPNVAVWSTAMQIREQQKTTAEISAAFPRTVGIVPGNLYLIYSRQTHIGNRKLHLI